jgi:c-di-GMP-binding flagellar brake protein YcgR
VSVLPRVGQMLRIHIVSPVEEISKHSYKTRVADVQGDTAAIEMPIHEETGSTVLLAEGSAIEASYIGEDGSSFHFRTEITGERKDNVRLLLIKLPKRDQITRTQRRKYLRVDTHIEIAVKTLDHVRKYHFLARTTDLSGGGLAFTCSDQFRFKVGDKLRIWMSLPSKSGSVAHAFAEAEVTRCKAPEEAGMNQWISVKFVHISQGDQAKIVRACYDRQLELHKKGIGE